MGIPMYVDGLPGKKDRSFSGSSDGNLQPRCRFRSDGAFEERDANGNSSTARSNSGHREERDTGNETVSEDEEDASTFPSPLASGRAVRHYSRRWEHYLSSHSRSEPPHGDRIAHRGAEGIQRRAIMRGRVNHPENTMQNVQVPTRSRNYASIRQSEESDRLRNGSNERLTAMFNTLRQHSNHSHQRTSHGHEQGPHCPPLPTVTPSSAQSFGVGYSTRPSGGVAARAYRDGGTDALNAVSSQRTRVPRWGEFFSPALETHRTLEFAAEGRNSTVRTPGDSPASSVEGGSSTTSTPERQRTMMNARSLSRWRTQYGTRSTDAPQGSFPPSAFSVRHFNGAGAAMSFANGAGPYRPTTPSLTSLFSTMILNQSPMDSSSSNASNIRYARPHLPLLRLQIGESGFATVAVANEETTRHVFHQ